MRRLLIQLIPSMFRRRLLLLVTIMALIVGGLAAQLFRLTVVQGAELRRRAEAALQERRLIPTIRGPILDRKGRVLAQDEASHDVGVQYAMIIGKWSYAQAEKRARTANRARWGELGFEERQALIREQQSAFDTQAEQLWQSLCVLGGISRAELEERKATVARRVQEIAADVRKRNFRRATAAGGEPPSWSELAQPVREERQAHAILFNVDERMIMEIRRNLARAAADASLVAWREVVLEDSRHRAYPLETLEIQFDHGSLPGPLRSPSVMPVTVTGVATHIVGGLRGLWQEDMRSRPFHVTGEGEYRVDLSGYLPGDRAGAWGIEKSMEERLRGTRGQLVQQLDTHEENRLEPVAGASVTLSIDAQLQARVQAVMAPDLGLLTIQDWHHRDPEAESDSSAIDNHLNGAALVLDIATGEVLAAVSMPSFTRAQLADAHANIVGDRVNIPFTNRAVAVPYQPGSTAKPLVWCAAVTQGEVGCDEVIDCRGYLFPDRPNQYRDWYFRATGNAFGPLDGVGALTRSSNYFFYTLGLRMGPPLMNQWYRNFGLAQSTGSGLIEEVAGFVRGGAPEESILMGIGQGPVAWTLIQAADVYASIARGGVRISPTFFHDDRRPQRAPRNLGIDPCALDRGMAGMSGVVNDASNGTGHHLASLSREPIFNIDGVRLYGKSGTATTGPLWVDDNNDGRLTGESEIKRRGPHAWFIVIAQRDGAPQPQYVIAVVVEHGGSGGVVAGPVANQILHALRAEGYL